MRSSRSATMFSNFALVSDISRCLGPVWSAVMNGKLISVCVVDDSSHLAFSAASLNLWTASLSLLKSTPYSLLNSFTIQFRIVLSKSSPPRNVSPFVARTSNTPDDISKIEMSNVPPPKSYTAIRPSECCLSTP